MSNHADDDLGDLLEETRILVPGPELIAAFLITLPFSQRFDKLTAIEQAVYIFTFFTTLVALACFFTPAVYHRIARPINDRRAFKLFANRFIVAGLVPFTLSLTLVSYLVVSMVLSTPLAILMS